MTRPSVADPTGIVIGTPVSIASMPRCMPSVGFIATVRTRFSPRCCSTSTMTSIGLAVPAFGLDADGVVDLGQVAAFEFDVDHRADDLDDLADFLCCCDCHIYLVPCSYQLSAASFHVFSADYSWTADS